MKIELPTNATRTPITIKPKYNKVTFDRERMKIRLKRGERQFYPIDVTTFKNSAEVLDWIFQVARKGWCDPETLHDLITCIEQACYEVKGNNAQGVFCPGGRDKNVQW